MTYFSDGELGARPRIIEEIGPSVWGALVSMIDGRIERGDFAARWPEPCPDGRGPISTNAAAMGRAAIGEVPELGEAVLTRPPRCREDSATTGWPLDPARLPPVLAVLDLVEFCWSAIAVPAVRTSHTFFGHEDLSDFDPEIGRTTWVAEVNRLFARNGLAYELETSGRIVRLGTEAVTRRVRGLRFETGDGELDELLDRARAKYLSADPAVRLEALEQLWGAFERAKTIRPGDKRQSISALIGEVATSELMAKELDEDARALTRIGNQFRIRHHESDRQPVEQTDLDYLSHRLFALLAHLLQLEPNSSSPGQARSSSE